MIEAIASLLINFGFVACIVFAVVRAVRRENGSETSPLVIIYITSMMCVEASHYLLDYQAPHPTRLDLIIGFSSTLVSILVVNRILVLLVGLRTRKYRETFDHVILLYLLTLFLTYSYVFQFLGLRDTVAGTTSHKLSDALYFVVMTFTTVGYGDLVPATQFGRMFAGLAAVNAYVVLALFLSIVLPRLMQSQGLSRERSNQETSVE